MLRFLTAGESHGPQLTVIVEGIPAGLAVDAGRHLTPELRRRQGGYGRGRRQQIETDEAQIVSGVRGGRSLGSSITLVIANRDWENWKGPMQVEQRHFRAKRVTRVRPGHADLAGSLKYGFDDARNVLERASARETAARVAAGAVARTLLGTIGIELRSYVQRIGEVALPEIPGDVDWAAVELSPVRCPDPDLAGRMVDAIDDRTLLVECSHVLFRTSTIVDVKPLVQKAHTVGALVMVDGYQAAAVDQESHGSSGGSISARTSSIARRNSSSTRGKEARS